MSKHSRKKTKPKVVAKTPCGCRKLYGSERRAVLELTSIPVVYHKNAIVKKGDDGRTHIYYGGLGKQYYHFHGHMIIGADGKMTYHRLPFSKHCEAEHYSDGMIQRGRKTKRRFCY